MVRLFVSQAKRNGVVYKWSQKGLLYLLISNLILTRKKFIAGGGLKNHEDLSRLKKIKQSNFEGVIAGKSFYVGNIDLKKAQQILDNNA